MIGDTIEDLTGYRIGEYKNFRLRKWLTSNKKGQSKVSIWILSNFEEPFAKIWG
jgi:hypothetical protein